MMKHVLPMIILLSVLTGAHAQTEFTMEDFPYPGLEIVFGDLDIGWGQDTFNFGKGGPNDTFDFSSLSAVLATNGADTSTLSYLSAGAIMMDEKPAAADVVTYEYEMDSTDTDTILQFYNFFNQGAGVFEGLGQVVIVDLSAAFGGPVTGDFDTIPFLYSNTDTLLSTAYELGYSTTVTSVQSAQIDDTTQISEHSIWSIDVDAFGTLVTHFGTFDSVFRVQRFGLDYDSTIVNGMVVESSADTNAIYEFYAKGVGHPIIRTSHSADFASAHRVEFLVSSNWQSAVTSLPKIQRTPVLNVFPNPGNGLFTLDLGNFQQAGRITVYNCLGQMVRSIKPAPGSRLVPVNLQSFEAGSYLILLEDQKGTIVARQRYLKANK